MQGIEYSFKKLDQWIENNGWEGYDPYDIKEKKLLIHLQKNRYTAFATEIVTALFPKLLRKVFRVEKRIIPKAMALFAKGYLSAYSKFGDKVYLNKALQCLDWLMKNPSKGYSGLCWGYPFNWQSRIFIPKGTPCSVVTSIAAHAFLDAYEILGDKKYLNVAESCCNFMINDLNIDRTDNDEICFSYTPIDNFHVHNANTWVASVLARVYRYTKNEKFKEMCLKAVNFTVSHQNEDGSWYYWAPPDKLAYRIDNYHTGFVLECLNIVRRELSDEFKYEGELRAGLKFYKESLFLDDGTPKMTDKRVYPIDIHSCAQGIITFCELADFEPEYLSMAEKVARWTIKHMQDEEGYFYYRIYRYFVDKTPYIRWGQAWMLRALSCLLY